MENNALRSAIEAAWDSRETITPATQGPARTSVAAALDMLDGGALRVAEQTDGGWVVHEWLKKAVLLSFRLNDNALVEGGAGRWWDKVPSKFQGWSADQFQQAGFRAVPGAIVRHSAFI